ncbi:hypothetical protein Vi05172_g3151 [Venturia inaequalis]|nr:hypothetical protein Vi05172_g3151 [Venturia inaequalis]
MATSPTGHASPGSSQGSFSEPSLEQLVEYFLSSKRSLSSISAVWRAREIVDSGREALEENAALCAKNTFVRHALDGQIEALEAIRHGASVVDAEGYDDFQTTVESLDNASARLNRTLVSLRSTLVESTFRPPTDPQKYLFDFVDEAGISELEESIKSSIDRFDTARSTFAETCEAFESDLGRLHESLLPQVEEEGQEKVHDVDGDTPIPGLFYALESHATEMATSLEGLVKHYDLCVTALKHTEGGGEAINQAASTEGHDQEASALAGLGVDLGKLDETPPKPMSEEEMSEMLAVLAKDAAEVEEVVSEIKDQLAEMEDQLAHVEAYLQTLRDTSKRLKHGMVLLKHVAGNVPSYITACAIFQGAWEDEKAVLSEKKEGLEGLKEFYSGFADAYDGLIIEVQRRKHVKKETEKVIKSAMGDLEKLYQADLEERESFRTDQADYIPSDLWAGLVNPPTRFRIVQADEDGDDDIPDIKKSVFEKAMQRVKERQKPFKRPA